MAAVLFACGNPSRGDDALGPLLLERVEAWLARHPESDLAAVGDFQLQIEHALDLDGRDVVLFVDAHASCSPPFEFRPVAPAEDDSFSTHALSPAALLQVYRSARQAEPPPAYVLGVRGERFDLGAPLSAAATANLEAAWRFLEGYLERGDAAPPVPAGPDRGAEAPQPLLR